jgi:hypothetical protein
MLAGLGSGQAGNFCGTAGNVVAVDDAPAEVPEAFPEVWRSEVATEIVGGRAALKVAEFVAPNRAPSPLSVTTSGFSNFV